MRTWRSPMSATSQGAFVDIPETSLCDISGIIIKYLRAVRCLIFAQTPEGIATLARRRARNSCLRPRAVAPGACSAQSGSRSAVYPQRRYAQLKKTATRRPFFAMQLKCIMAEENQADEVRLDHPSVFERRYPLLSQYPKLLVSDPGSNIFGQDRIRR